MESICERNLYTIVTLNHTRATIVFKYTFLFDAYFFRPYLEKIKRNILHTFKIDIESFEKLADDIENAALESLNWEITSQEIGEMVMERLRQLDEVSYVRFASVYREFKDVNSFMQELRGLMDQHQKKES